MQQEVYRRLAIVLDALPNKFPATESGVKFRMLAKLFTEEEASLACVMQMEAEPAADIAARAGSDPKENRNTLKRMVAKELIDIRRGKGVYANSKTEHFMSCSVRS